MNDTIERCVNGSLIIRGVAVAVRWYRWMNQRLLAGLAPGSTLADRGPDAALLTDSRLVAIADRAARAVQRAWRGSVSCRVADACLASDPASRVFLVASAAISAVTTHALLSLAIGPPVGWIGWSARAAVFTVAVAAVSRPRAFATAWTQARIRSAGSRR